MSAIANSQPTERKAPLHRWTRNEIARRVAQDITDGMVVNLGIGLPTMVAGFVPPGLRVYFQSENGIIGFGARPPEGMEDVHLTDAGGAFVSALPGAVAFDSATSFALIRGGHLDMTVLGGLQVDRRGHRQVVGCGLTVLAGRGDAGAGFKPRRRPR